MSQRWETQIHTTPFQLYRALRVVNPSPLYGIICASPASNWWARRPETLVRCEDGGGSLRPIAGTRRRGKTPDEDQDLARRSSLTKGTAEHVMLVDLGPERCGTWASRGSVKVDSLMQVERYSHVMHIVSQVTGQLEPGKIGL